MEPTFKILTAAIFPETVNLFAEINLWGITYIVTGSDNTCLDVISYHFPADTNFERAAVYIKQSVAAQNILQTNFANITIAYTYPAAMLVPNALMGEADPKKMLELVYGDVNDGYIRTEFSYKHQLHTVYAIPKTVDAVVSYLFANAVTRHHYGLFCETLSLKGNKLHGIFGNGYFTAQLGKSGRLQALQSFSFKTPEDAAYYLLQLCSNYDLPVDEVTLELSGMVNAGSVLYGELYKYFPQIKLQTLPEEFSYPEDINQVPSHYFSHLFQMILCG